MNSSNSKITVFLPTTTIDPHTVAPHAVAAAAPPHVNINDEATLISFCATMQMQPR